MMAETFSGEEVDFDVEQEFWNSYKLKDGTTLKVKLVLLRVIRAKDSYDPAGFPVYMIMSTNVVRAVDVPEGLRRKPKLSPEGAKPV
jgi:hypothetical protein